jgi:hypothetical protein
VDESSEDVVTIKSLERHMGFQSVTCGSIWTSQRSRRMRPTESVKTQLGEDYCWAPLTGGSFGRVAPSAHAMPIIVPVRSRDRHRTLRAQPPEDAGLDDALAQTVVAFNADRFDDDAHRA